MNNNYNNTMNNDDNDNTMDYSNVSSSNSLLMVEAIPSTPAQKHQPGTSSALYKLAARNLRKYHGVPSMTALKLEKTVALLGLAPRRLVVQGLAPRRLLKGGKGGSSPQVLAGDSLQEGQDELREAATGELMMMDENLINNNNSSSEDLLLIVEEEEEEEEEEEDSNSSYDDNGDSIGNYSGDEAKGDAEGFEANGNGNGKTRRPIHAALVGAGINLRPRETRPLLRALGVSPHRLVKLGLVKREAGGGPSQHVRAGRPRKVGVGGPRDPPRHAHGPSHGPPHAHGVGPSLGGGLSRSGPMDGPSRPFHGAGLRTMHRDGASEEQGMSAPSGRLGGPAPLGPHGGPGHREPHHHRGRLQGPPHGPGHHSMPTVRHGRAPPGGGKHEQAGRGLPGSGKHGPHGHGRGHGHDGGGLHGEGLEEGDRPLHRGGRGPGQHGPRRHAGGGMGGSRGRPHGPPHGPFQGVFHESASGAPPGMMAHIPHGSSPGGGGGMKQRGGRHGGGTGFCGRQCGGCGGGGGGGGGLLHKRMAHLAHFDGRHQPQLEA